MKIIFSTGSGNKIYLLENDEEIVFLIKKNDKEQTISLRKESILLCSGDSGTCFVSDGYELFYIHNGLIDRIYEASYRIYELIYVAGAAFVIDENILISVDNNGKLMWQYWHYEPIDKVSVDKDCVEFVDENNSSFRVSVKDGKLLK